MSTGEGRLIDLDPTTVREWLQRGEAVVVDVREPEEFAEERIPGAVTLPLSRFDPSALPRDREKKPVLACLFGRRSLRAAELLFAAGHRRAFHLAGGLVAWKEAGLSTES